MYFSPERLKRGRVVESYCRPFQLVLIKAVTQLSARLCVAWLYAYKHHLGDSADYGIKMKYSTLCWMQMHVFTNVCDFKAQLFLLVGLCATWSWHSPPLKTKLLKMFVGVEQKREKELLSKAWCGCQSSQTWLRIQWIKQKHSASNSLWTLICAVVWQQKQNSFLIEQFSRQSSWKT